MLLCPRISRMSSRRRTCRPSVECLMNVPIVKRARDIYSAERYWRKIRTRRILSQSRSPDKSIRERRGGRFTESSHYNKGASHQRLKTSVPDLLPGLLHHRFIYYASRIMPDAATGILSQAPPHPRRFVTSHDEQGNAIFKIEGDIPHTQFYKSEEECAVFHVPWTTEGLPVTVSDTEDRAVTKAGGSLARENGIVCRYVDFPPNTFSPMHRTHSLDYGKYSWPSRFDLTRSLIQPLDPDIRRGHLRRSGAGFGQRRNKTDDAIRCRGSEGDVSGFRLVSAQKGPVLITNGAQDPSMEQQDRQVGENDVRPDRLGSCNDRRKASAIESVIWLIML
jgi:hypothetical protein